MASRSPNVHSVHFYDSDEALIARLSAVVGSALHSGDSALIVATPEHQGKLRASLRLHNDVDTTRVQAEARLQLFNADEMLAQFMIGDTPDRGLFLSIIGGAINTAREAARSQHRGLAVFGEMVGILWEQGNHAGAIGLEKLWNELLSERTFHLHCAYARKMFREGESLAEICDTHSHVIGADLLEQTA